LTDIPVAELDLACAAERGSSNQCWTENGAFDMESLAFPSIDPSDPPSPYALVTVTATQAVDALTLAVRNAFQDAMMMRGALCDDAYRVQGYSGKKFRLFLNNLMNELADPRYLEIGVYHGASFCPAVYLNQLRAVAVDNWSQYEGQRSVFENNLARFTSELTDIEIIEEDFVNIDYAAIGKFNVMFYDGLHREIDQYNGVLIPAAAMDDNYILIVDDWNDDRVRRGTFNGLRDGGLSIEYSVEVRTTYNGEFPLVNGMKSEWHNGALIAVISKL
jgi:hypothetical protein